LRAIEWDASFDDEAALLKMAQDSRITLDRTIGGNRVLLNGKDISARIRERDVTEAASRVSVHPKVREWMVARQREMGIGGGVVMEGRDIGTKVFPDADLKIFLDADPVIREQRRLDQQRVKGAPAEAWRGTSRARPAGPHASGVSAGGREDAVVLDSTHMSEDEVNRQEVMGKKQCGDLQSGIAAIRELPVFHSGWKRGRDLRVVHEQPDAAVLRSTYSG
jgi:CMP/dCMP kinase